MKQIQKSVPRILLKSPNRYEFSNNAVALLAMFSPCSETGKTLYLRKKIQKIIPLLKLSPLRKLSVLDNICIILFVIQLQGMVSLFMNLWHRESHEHGVNMELSQRQWQELIGKTFLNPVYATPNKVLISNQVRAYKL